MDRQLYFVRVLLSPSVQTYRENAFMNTLASELNPAAGLEKKHKQFRIEGTRRDHAGGEVGGFGFFIFMR
jgi:hypothetical protein